MESQSYNLGLSMAAAALGVSVDDVMRKKASVDEVANHQTPGYGAVQRMVCKYAAEAYRESGNMDKFMYHMYEKLASTKNWYPALDPYYDAAVAALGKVNGGIRKDAADQERSEVLEKAANNPFRAAMAGMLKMSPDVIKTMLAGGAAAGLTGGSLAWLANRSVAEDEPKLEAMKQKINYYNQLTDEIESQLASRSTPATRDEVEEVVNDII